MKISKRTEYALRSVVFISKQGGKIVSASDISSQLGISIKFLEQVLRVLKSGKIVRSERGNKGGYVVDRNPSELTLLEIVSLFEDSLIVKPSSSNGNGAGPSETVFGEIWTEINDGICSKLKKVSVEDVVHREKEISSSHVHNFII